MTTNNYRYYNNTIVTAILCLLCSLASLKAQIAPTIEISRSENNVEATLVEWPFPSKGWVLEYTSVYDSSEWLDFPIYISTGRLINNDADRWFADFTIGTNQVFLRLYDYFARLDQQTGILQTASGLRYEVISEGSGEKPNDSSTVTVHYEGKFTDGVVFDSSISRGTPAVFAVTGVIEGFAEGLKLMSPGAKYILYIPSDLAYGATGNPTIPPHTIILFDLELISFQ